MKKGGKYDTAGLIEDHYEPGSCEVLKNLQGITGKRKIFAAVRAGLDRNYKPMELIFSGVVSRSLRNEM